MNLAEINICFNNENLSIQTGATVQNLIEDTGLENDHFIIVLNGCVLQRSQYSINILKHGDVIDLITPISGG